MDYFKILSGKARACIQKYDMLRGVQTVGVGLSGGADSTMLLCVLKSLSEYMPEKFNIKAFTVDMGFENADFSSCRALCEGYGIEYRIIKTDMAKTVFEKKRDNPCYICSKIRRGALCSEAVRHGCTALALGHNEDDAAQTLMLNLLNKGSISSFSPVTRYESITVIRPFVSSSEKLIRSAAKQLDMALSPSVCPVDKKTKRQSVKSFLESEDRENRGVCHRLVNALCEMEIDGYKK